MRISRQAGIVALLAVTVAMCAAPAARSGRYGRRRKGPETQKIRNKMAASSMREYVHKHRRQPVYCFQCAFSPAKDVYETVRAPSVVKDRHGNTKVAYRTRLVKVRRQGGWDKCVGPFNHTDANHYGIDVKACDNTCYARLETSGNIFRGCYKGSYAVDPYKYGCHKQQGAIWCFCQGHVCNNQEIVGALNSEYS